MQPLLLQTFLDKDLQPLIPLLDKGGRLPVLHSKTRGRLTSLFGSLQYECFTRIGRTSDHRHVVFGHLSFPLRLLARGRFHVLLVIRDVVHGGVMSQGAFVTAELIW